MGLPLRYMCFWLPELRRLQRRRILVLPDRTSLARLGVVHKDEGAMNAPPAASFLNRIIHGSVPARKSRILHSSGAFGLSDPFRNAAGQHQEFNRFSLGNIAGRRVHSPIPHISQIP